MFPLSLRLVYAVIHLKVVTELSELTVSSPIETSITCLFANWGIGWDKLVDGSNLRKDCT